MTRPPKRRLISRLLRGKPAQSPPEGNAPLAPTTAEDQLIIDRASPYSMTGPLRLQALVDAVRYCERRNIPGAFAECGVWRGGSVLAMILTLQELGAERDIHLFDTFEGMTEPTEHDTSSLAPRAMDEWAAAKAEGKTPWEEVFGPEAFDEEAVVETVLSTGYPRERVHVARGPVEETIPDAAPGNLALLRLDTDWYESTRHELEHLYPRLEPGGVLVIDDYGHWDGARQAVDEYFGSAAAPLLLNRIDYTGRVAVKH